MRTPSFRTMVPIFIAVALLAAPPARGAGWFSSPLEGIWARLSALWAEGGCVIDPDGLCRDKAGPAKGITTDTGCGIDPNGDCRGQVSQAREITANTGCGIDPDGRCHDGVQAPFSLIDRQRLP